MSASDTESEPDNSLPKWNATDFADTYTQIIIDDACEDRSDGVRRAVGILSSINIQSVIQDTSRHNDIQAASSVILAFISDFISSGVFLDGARREIVDAFSCLLNTSFIFLLLEYRRVFHSIAIKQIPPGTAISSVICWVDVILSQLTAAVISGPKSPDHPKLSPLQKQREDDILRAAAQLPCEWNDILGIISSDTASPASSRLALRLAFAVYIIGGQICSNTLTSHDSDELRAVFNIYIHHISGSKLVCAGAADSILGSDIYLQERTSYAMVLALIAEAELISSKASETPIFRPYTSAILMHLIQNVLHPESSPPSVPLVTLDVPQRLLVCWGQTTYWSWTNWDGERVIGSELLATLTATWLYHLPQSEIDSSWQDIISSLLVKNAEAASIAIIILLRRLIQNMTAYMSAGLDATTGIVYYRCAWMAKQLLDPSNGWSISMVADLTCCLLGLLTFICDIGHEDVNDLILQGLSFLDSVTLKSALSSVQADIRINFAMKFDLAISNTTGSLLDGQADDTCLPARQVLTFLTILWNSGVPGGFHKDTVTAFFSSLVDRISTKNAPHLTLGRTLLIALTCLESFDLSSMSTIINRTWGEKTIWMLAMNLDPTDLLTTSAFANYVISTAKDCKCDPLCYVDAWDRLRDCLLLILGHHFFGDEEPLALIIVGTLCHALTCLLRYADSNASESQSCCRA